MTVHLRKVNKGLKGQITVPGDKSISHRAIILGSIALGKTTISGFLPGNDCLSTIECFKNLGVDIKQHNDFVEINGKGITGLTEPNCILNVGNSGTTIRLLMGVLSHTNFYTSLTGDESICKRPMDRVVHPLKQMGTNIDGRVHGRYAPLSIRGGDLKGQIHRLNVASAQVKSAILLAGLFATGETTVVEPYQSRDHTERMLKKFGVKINRDRLRISLLGNQKLIGTNIIVPGDISSAAFLIVAATIIPNSKIIIKNVGLNPTRTGVIDVLKQMGANIKIMNYREAEEPYGDIIVTASSLSGTTISGDLIPKLIDEIPIIALAATQAKGKTIIKDAEELKVKESNRIDTVVKQLKQMGAHITAIEDGMIINGKTNLIGTDVDCYKDHRIGMMLSVAALLSEGDTTIKNSDCINISYPNFLKDLAFLSGK